MCRGEDAGGLFTGQAPCARCRHATGDRHASWGTDPVDVAGLDCASPRWEPWRAMFRSELRTLAALAARHQEEFRELLERETVIEALADDPG